MVIQTGSPMNLSGSIHLAHIHENARQVFGLFLRVEKFFLYSIDLSLL